LRRILFEAHVFNNTDYSRDALDRVREVIHFAEKSKLHTTCSNIVGRYPARYPCRGPDIMASLLHLKAEYDRKSSRSLRLTFAGAAEAHLLAQEIGEAGVSVVLTPSRPFPDTWTNGECGRFYVTFNGA